MARKTQRKWVIYNPSTLEKIKTITINHQTNLLYFETDVLDNVLKLAKLAAYDYDALNQPYLKGKSFSERLRILQS